MQITFKKVVRKDKHFNCRKTSRVRKFRSGGKAVYAQNCSRGRTTTSTSGEEPVKILAESGAGIRKGSHLYFSRSEEDSSQGSPIEAFKSKKRKVLVNYYGLPLR